MHDHTVRDNGSDECAICILHFEGEGAELVLLDCLDVLLARNKRATQICRYLHLELVVIQPLSAMLVNDYETRNSVLTYDLPGMGCSASLLSIDLASDLLQVHRNEL